MTARSPEPLPGGVRRRSRAPSTSRSMTCSGQTPTLWSCSPSPAAADCACWARTGATRPPSVWSGRWPRCGPGTSGWWTWSLSTRPNSRNLLATLMSVDEGPERFARWLRRQRRQRHVRAAETLKAMFENGTLAKPTPRAGTAGSTPSPATTRAWAPSAYRSHPAAHRASSALPPSYPAGRRRGGGGVQPAAAGHPAREFELAEQDALEGWKRSGMVAGTAFRHDLIRQSVYASLAVRPAPAASRAPRRLCDRAMQTLEAERWIVVERHLLAAGELEPAARAFGRAHRPAGAGPSTRRAVCTRAVWRASAQLRARTTPRGRGNAGAHAPEDRSGGLLGGARRLRRRSGPAGGARHRDHSGTAGRRARHARAAAAARASWSRRARTRAKRWS